MKVHGTHDTRISDSSLYDEKCTACGATDASPSKRLEAPCPAFVPRIPTLEPGRTTLTPSDDLGAIYLQALVNNCHRASFEAGWWTRPDGTLIDNPEQVPVKLMLIVSEIAEAMEAHRKSLMDDKLPRRPGIEVELADAVIRICDLAGALGLDLGGALVEKMRFNTIRADHKPENRAAAGGKAY